MTEDEMVGWIHQQYGHKCEQTLGHSEGQGSLVWCSPWGHKELDMTERLNCTEWYNIKENKTKQNYIVQRSEELYFGKPNSLKMQILFLSRML